MLVLNTLRSRLPGEFETPRCIHHWGVVLPILRSIKQSLKRIPFSKLTVGYSNYCFLYLKNASPKESNRLPSVCINGESITSKNNSTNIRNLFWTCRWDQEKLFEEKKTGDEISRDTVPLKHALRARTPVLFLPDVGALSQVHFFVLARPSSNKRPSPSNQQKSVRFWKTRGVPRAVKAGAMGGGGRWKNASFC